MHVCAGLLNSPRVTVLHIPGRKGNTKPHKPMKAPVLYLTALRVAASHGKAYGLKQPLTGKRKIPKPSKIKCPGRWFLDTGDEGGYNALQGKSMPLRGFPAVGECTPVISQEMSQNSAAGLDSKQRE